MVTIPVQTAEGVLTKLEEIARQRQTTVEAVAREALLHYLGEPLQPSAGYSFIGIWHSGKRSVSQEVEAALEQAADRQAGWKLPE